MRSFADNQERMRRYLNETFGGLFSFNQFEELGRKNLAMFEEAMHMFTPGAATRPAERPPDAPPSSTAAPAPTETSIDELRTRLEQMQREIDQLSGRKREDKGEKT
jgi:polyhydroxyalkanoate synthesis regulator protein